MNLMYDKLKNHIGHHVVCSSYGDAESPADICIECEDCNEVLVSADDYEVADREELADMMSREDLCEALSDVIIEELMNDDESPEKRGRYLIKAFMENNVNDAMIALCGWSFDSLISKAKERI